jgi:N-acetylmuramoyl-L-alanine amidase
MMKVVISSGHGKYIRGASGVLDEVDEARKVVNRVAEFLHNNGVGVEIFHDDTSTSQNQNLETIVDFHNSHDRNLDCSVHFNAFDGSAHGTEVLYTTQEKLAGEICDAIVESGGFTDRGPKYRSDLYFLNQTEMPAVLLEVAFCDHDGDAELYRAHFNDICQAIAETIAGEPLEAEEQPEEPIEVSDNRVVIDGAVEGDVTVILNGQVLRERVVTANVVTLNIKMHGDVSVTINGQDFHNKPTIPNNQCKIVATVFGGEADYNVSAYDENKVLNDSDLYVALPDRFEDERPLVRVYNRTNGESATAEIWDVGPWNINDPYWDTGTRPQAESGTDMDGEKTNGAGIDLSPALAAKLGIDGMGTVDWEFVE